MKGPPLPALNFNATVKVTITKFTGVGQPTVVVAQQRITEPQGGKRPALRLIQGGRS